MKPYVTLIFLAVLVLCMCCTSTRHAEEKEAASLSAEAWIGHVDNENYSESWENSAEYFKNSISRDEWQQVIRTVRMPLGKAVSRKPISFKYENIIPGAPQGEYVIIQYRTSFENKKNAIETITPMRDRDGTWKVSGYYIK